MKKIIFMLLLMPCWCWVSGQIRPDKPEPAKPSILNPIGIFKTDEGVIKDLVLLIDSLKIELYKCQEKSKVDELIIERLFEGIKKEGITVPANLYTATYDSLGNIYFKEK